MSTRELRCCCGRNTCAYLARNYSVLHGLERDVCEAGKAGQSLLQRHEQYINESCAERERLLNAMDAMEQNKAALEASNARIIHENRTLLDQLEQMNSAVTESDLHISSLNSTLEATQRELRRLNSLAHKAAQLETELAALESERAQLDVELAVNQEDTKLAVHRWKKAESTIGGLQKQIDSMEREAREEHTRQTEALLRPEAQSTVGPPSIAHNTGVRASGAAGASTKGGGAITHFVKDILQDNSNLQLGMVELREMLLASHSEVTSLRSQLGLHQLDQATDLQAPNLASELQMIENDDQQHGGVPKELHVHHHYHQQHQQQQRSLLRKPRKRRTMLPMAQFLRFPASSALPNDHARTGPGGFSQATTTSLSNTSATVPANHRARWSMQSTTTESSYAPSSLSTSPRHPSSIFDNFEAALDCTRPSTPSSSAPGSPTIFAAELRQAQCENIFEASFSLSSKTTSHFRQPSYLGDSTIPEEQEYLENGSLKGAASALNLGSTTPRDSRPQFRRVMSHESLLSISGMDIHASSHSLNSLFDPENPSSFISANSPRHAYSTPAVISTIAASSVRAEPCLTQGSNAAKSILSQHSPKTATAHDEGNLIGKRMGGWMLGKWASGSTHTPSMDVMTPKNTTSLSPKTLEQPVLFRSPGINQKGPILGLSKPQRAPSSVQPSEINLELLKECLTRA